jgi:hypothetical protein
MFHRRADGPLRPERRQELGKLFVYDHPDDFRIEMIVGMANNVAEVPNLAPRVLWQHRLGGLVELYGGF